jgi:hypothetical protein
LNSVERDTRVRFAVVWDGVELVALLPFVQPRLRLRAVHAGAHAWQSKYSFSCTPLLDRRRQSDAAAALVNVLGSVCPGEWMVPRLNIEGGSCKALIAALENRGSPWRFGGAFPRASLSRGASFEEHLSRHISVKRRKDLSRTRRRLEEKGRIEFSSHCSGEGLDKAVAAFLRIEASGWKGERGTALACDPDTTNFALSAFTGREGESICRADVLSLDGVAIAVGLIVFAGSTGFTVKGAYDETYRGFSPGLILELEVIKSFLTDGWASRLDAATDGAHVIDSLWPDRVEVADLLFSLAPRAASVRLAAFRFADACKRQSRNAAKNILNRLSKS